MLKHRNQQEVLEDSLSDIEYCLFDMLEELNKELKPKRFELVYTTIPTKRKGYDRTLYVQICYIDIVNNVDIGEFEIDYIHHSRKKCVCVYNGKEEFAANTALVKKHLLRAIRDSYDAYMTLDGED